MVIVPSLNRIAPQMLKVVVFSSFSTFRVMSVLVLSCYSRGCLTSLCSDLHLVSYALPLSYSMLLRSWISLLHFFILNHTWGLWHQRISSCRWVCQ
ncbi:hypothetical protein DPMN_129875 [Dreissena polymorpha]|uniref:Uncharacterized protein n=1 Tax=Dreissena polymorpha TaxID=45954 RepID=A0A9D4JYN5_DREPO|nr:hypothetical protein DPMN_129875 [Dreissena polymorpha]